ncbi:MAG: alpha-glucosidase C-terminal domain-containing protein [Paracoccaceae bacterium]
MRAVSRVCIGKTIFLDTRDPLLAFRRQSKDQTLTCVFNLSPDAMTVTLDKEADLTGLHSATRDANTVHLPGNGFAFLAHDGPLALR